MTLFANVLQHPLREAVHLQARDCDTVVWFSVCATWGGGGVSSRAYFHPLLLGPVLLRSMR